jgi:hypothetical protein
MTAWLEQNWRAAVLWVIAAAATLIAISLAAKFCLNTGLAWQCPVMAVLHLPCPSCGSTRAFAALSEFRFLEALRFNPLVVLAIAAGPLAFAFSSRLPASARVSWTLFVVAVFLNWVYLLFYLPR